jgi:GMP synthase (glutamine-hydrolysing)
MRIHHLQHVEFEGLGSIAPHLLRQGHQLSATHLYDLAPLPSVDSFDALIVMGGPMGVADTDDYPWLEAEMVFIARTIQAGKKVLGICLGAQLIAAALGAKVYRNRCPEIGWWELTATDAAVRSRLLPQSCLPFHWHGDTFDLPDGATLLASSEACTHQAFIFDQQTIALQFHLETTADSALALINQCGDEIDGSHFVQSIGRMLGKPEHFAASNTIMANLLDRWLEK